MVREWPSFNLWRNPELARAIALSGHAPSRRATVLHARSFGTEVPQDDVNVMFVNSAATTLVVVER